MSRCFCQAEDGIRDGHVTGVQTCALPIWVGLRPLVQRQKNADAHTKQLSREHVIKVDSEGLVTVTGGKWTTYRTMAEDVLTHCQQHRLLPGGLSRRSEEHTSELQSRGHLVCRLLLEKKKKEK